jgi:hypothetical protein
MKRKPPAAIMIRATDVYFEPAQNDLIAEKRDSIKGPNPLLKYNFPGMNCVYGRSEVNRKTTNINVARKYGQTDLIQEKNGDHFLTGTIWASSVTCRMTFSIKSSEGLSRGLF